jgi:hypothetical protein
LAGMLFKNNYWHINQMKDDEMGEVSIGNWSNAKCVHMLVGKPEGVRRVRGTTSRRNDRTIRKHVLKNKGCPSGLD